ncbi:MAG: hypothetical protein ACLQDM_06375 [Bradyrhizobium sp.]
MTKFGLIGAAAALASLLAGPALARHVTAHPSHYAWSSYCATIEPGNPHCQMYHHEAWSDWRARGDWDNRGDDACARNPIRALCLDAN